jgi:lipopolysaccharide/colanic/teichoic acid biosynthesis glycosyltransferase
MDLDYLNHMSLREDLRIIFLTVVNILAGKKI